MTGSTTSPESGGVGSFYGISLLLHAVLLALVFTVPSVRDLFVTQITAPASEGNATVPQENHFPTPSAAISKQDFDRALDRFIKDPSQTGAARDIQTAGKDLVDAAMKAREKFAADQARELARKLGISPEEALKILPTSDPATKEFLRMVDQLEKNPANGTSPAERLQTLRELAAKLADHAQSDEQMSKQLDAGEIPMTNLSVTADPQTRRTVEKLLAEAATIPSSPPRDLTGLMKSYYGDETAANGALYSGEALLNDAVPGRVQVTKSGLRPPPVLDDKWLSSVYKGETLPSLPASRISAGGGVLRSGPLFLDSWYIVGPWPLENQKDFWKAFPPESDGVDLNATYTGKRGRQLHWEFVQSSEPLVEIPLQVPDSTTYAFTALDFDKDTEAWMLCGSDDRMKLWINGLPVFGSVASLKGWHIGNEGARKVFFHKGRNEILVRVDNLPGFTRFSVVLMPADSEDLLFSTKP